MRYSVLLELGHRKVWEDIDITVSWSKFPVVKGPYLKVVDVKGDIGDQGVVGTAGLNGDRGYQGIAGNNGAKGDAGAASAAGADGDAAEVAAGVQERGR